MLVPVGTRHMGTDMFNTVNGDVYGEFKKATMVVPTAKIDFAAFVDAVANLNIESTDNQPEKVAPQTFAFVHPGDTAELRKNLAEDLKYVEAFARAGYIGTVGGVNIYTKKDATKGTIVVATDRQLPSSIRRVSRLRLTVTAIFVRTLFGLVSITLRL